MAPKQRKLLFNAIRIALCIGALWIVMQGVTIRDHVQLADGQTVVGAIESIEPVVVVRLEGGLTQEIPRESMASDEHGDPIIQYGLISIWHQSHKQLLLASVAVYFVVVFLQALRFQWVLSAQDIKLSYWQSCRLSIAGNFLNFATPLGSNAGDVFKAYFLSLHIKRKTEAVATVLLDRVIGLGTLLAVAVAIVLLSPASSRLATLRPYLVGMFSAGVVGTLIYFSPFVRRRLRSESLINKYPILDHIRRVDSAAMALASHKLILIGAIFMTVALQAIAVSSYFMVALALQFKAGLSDFFEFYAYFGAGVVVAALPGPPQGLGTVELFYRFFFQSFGTPSQIIVMALTIRLIMLACSLPGLLVTLSGSYKPREVKPAESTAPILDSPVTEIPHISKS